MTQDETLYYNNLKNNDSLNPYVFDKLFSIINGHTVDKPNVALQLLGGVPMVVNTFNDSNIFAGLFPQGLDATNFNENTFQGIANNKSFEEMSAFKNSPFGQHWEKNLPNWALDYYGLAKVTTTANLKFVDLTQKITQADANNYNALLKGKINPYQYTIFIARDGDGEKVLRDYNDPKIIPKANEIFVFIELDDGKFDFGKIVRVKLGANVVKDMQLKISLNFLSDQELATEIIRKINLFKNDNQVTNDINNSIDFNKLLVRAIDYEYNNKQFDDMSYFLLFLNGIEFLEFKSIDWLKDISHWLRQRKYEDEKYWNGHLTKGYEPAFLPTLLFNKTKAEKEKLIKEMVNKPLAFIDELVDNQFKEKTPISNFIKLKLQNLKNQIDQKLKPIGSQIIDSIAIAENIETIIQYYNALWVGIWNGIIEFIAALLDLAGIIIAIIKQEVGLRITDALYDKLENLCNFVYYDTQKFLDLILDKAITFVYQVYYLDFNGYKVAKEIGELIPDIVTIATSWLKASKAVKAGTLAVATEELATKEILEKINKESIKELEEKAFKEVEEKLDDLTDEISEAGKINDLIKNISGIKGFTKWFDEISLKDFEILWSNSNGKSKIIGLIRHPGGKHEWLMCSRSNIFKKWGVSMNEIKSLRTEIENVIFKNPPGYHGGPGSTKAHNEILDLIDNSKNYIEFKGKLIKWSETRLEGGKDSLPNGFFE